LQAIDGGKKAIAAVERLMQRMRAAGPKPDNHTDWYEGGLSFLRAMQGISFLDDSIRDTLRIKFSVTLSDEEFRGFVKYLIQNYPTYPGRTEGEIYRDHSDLNEAGNPRILVLLKNPERFYRLYLSYKAGTQP
jgi:hypothetical protein